MKNSKKLLILALSLVLLIGVFAVCAFAEEAPAATVVYPDGSQASVAVGERIPGVDGTLCYAPGNTLYKDCAITGAAVTDGVVPEDAAGKTITITGTKVYFAIAVKDGETTYHTEASTAGSSLKSYMEQEKALADVDITLYADLESDLFRLRGHQNSNYFLDVNGHELTLPNTMYVFGAHVSLYSSQPGGVVRSKAAVFYNTSNWSNYGSAVNGYFYVGERRGRAASDPSYGNNLTVYCQQVNSHLEGGNTYIYGGTFIQTAESTAKYFFVMDRATPSGARVQSVSKATFVLTNPETVPLYLCTTENRTFSGCAFISPNEDGVALSAYAPEQMRGKITFDSCKFVNVQSFASVAKISHKDSLFSGAMPELPADSFLIHTQPQSLTANGKTYVFDMTFGDDLSGLYGINWNDVYTDYWALGTTPYCPNVDNFNQVIELENGAICNFGASIDPGVFVPVTERMLGTFTKVVPTFEHSGPIALFWKQTDGTTGFIALEDGMTAEDIGAAFHSAFNTLAFGCEIKLYADLVLPAAMGWGPMGSANEYESLKKGSVVLDLNGYTFTVPALSAGINLSDSNNSVASEAVFGFEFDAGENSFTLKSSRPGARILNNSSLPLIGVGEQAAVAIVIEGENLTYVGKAAVTHAFEIKNAANAAVLSVNGGLYIIESNHPAFSFVGTAAIRNAEVVMRGNAPVAFVAAHGANRNAAFTVENCLVYSVNAAPLFSIVGDACEKGTPAAASTVYALTVKGCYLLGGVSVVKQIEHLDSLTYAGENYAITAQSALIANPTGAIAAKRITTIDIAGEAQEFTLYLGTRERETLKVYYDDIVPTEYYLPGSLFRPVVAELLKDKSFDWDKGILTDIEGYKAPMCIETVTDGMRGAVLNAVPNINYVEKPIAVIVLMGGNVESYVLLSSPTYGQEMIDMIASAGEGAEIRLYADVTASAAVSNTAAITLNLCGKKLYVSSPFKAEKLLTVKNGSVILTEAVSALFEGKVVAEDASFYSLAQKVPFTTETATLKNSKAYNLILGTNTLLCATVFHSDETASAFGEGIEENVANTTGSEILFVNGEKYAVMYSFAATDKVSNICLASFYYKGAKLNEKKYYVGSVPSFRLVAAEGYFIAYDGKQPIYADADLACAFAADASKLQAKIVITERLNFIFYLQKQDCLENLVFAGEALEMSTLKTETVEGVEYFVLPYTFASFANCVDEVTLAVDVLYGADERETLRATVSLADYAKTLLSDITAKEEEKQLAYALVVYVDEMLKHFEMPRSRAISEVISTYSAYATAFVAPDAQEVSSDYVRGALYIANENLDFALRVNADFEGDITISFAGGASKTYSYEDIVILDGYSYIVVKDISFADVGEGLDVEIQLEGETVEAFTYSIATYTQAMAAQNMGYTPTYVMALYNFVSLAAHSNG